MTPQQVEHEATVPHDQHGAVHPEHAQLSFRALDDGAFCDAVESKLVDELTGYATKPGLHRLFSLRHEFPDAYAKLRTTTGSAKQITQIDIAATHFPYFLSSQKLSAANMRIMLRPKTTDPVDTNGLTLAVNGAHSGTWDTLPNTNLRSTDTAVSGRLSPRGRSKCLLGTSTRLPSMTSSSSSNTNCNSRQTLGRGRNKP